MRRMSPLERLDVVNEIRLLASIMHVNICRYYEAFMDGNFLCIVMEFAINGAQGVHCIKQPRRALLGSRTFVRNLLAITPVTRQCTLLTPRNTITSMHGDPAVPKAGDLARFIRKGKEAKKVRRPRATRTFLEQ